MVKIFTKASNVKNYQANAEYNYMYPKELISDLIIRRGISFGMIKKSDSLKSYLAKRDILLYSKYNDNINVSFSSCFLNADIERRFFRTLTDMDIPVEITANNISE